MAGKQQGIPINSERFRIALSKRGFSLFSFGELLKHHNIIQLRMLHYCLKNERMNPQVLDKLCRLIDVSPDFVTGNGVYKEDYVPSYYGFELSKEFHESEKSLMQYLLSRKFKKEHSELTARDFVDVPEDWFRFQLPEIESLVHSAVQKFIDESEDF